MRRQIIAAGVKNLREFGYPHANEKNILTDYVYGSFFDKMLESNLPSNSASVDAIIKELRKEIKQNLKGGK